MPEGPFLDGALAVQPVRELVRRSDPRPDRAFQVGAGLRNTTIEVLEVLRLLPHRARACRPQVVRVTGEVAASLREERRYAAQLRSETAFRLYVEGKRVRPELDGRVVRRSLVGRSITLLHVDGLVERGIASPRLEDANVEVEPVHLRKDESVVHLLRDRPLRRIDAAQARPERRELSVPALEGRGRVVGCAIAQRRPLEDPPLLEQLDERLVTVFHRLLLCKASAWGGGQDRRNEDRRDELSGANASSH
jgi:hypothetical protein